MFWVVSIGLFWFCFGSFSYSGVCILCFIFNHMLGQYQGTHSFTAKFKSAKSNFLSLTLCSLGLVQLYITHAFTKIMSDWLGCRIISKYIFVQRCILCKECKWNYSPAQRIVAFHLHWNFFLLTMKSLTESFNWSNIILHCTKMNKMRDKYFDGDYFLTFFFLLIGVSNL